MNRLARRSALFLCSVGVVTVCACSDFGDPIPPPTTPDVPTEVKFARNVQPIFNSRCAVSGCHVSPLPKAGCDLSADSSYVNLVNVPTQVFTPGVRVTPGDLSQSVLYLLVESGLMPASGPPVNSGQLRTIRQWIEDGAPNN